MKLKALMTTLGLTATLATAQAIGLPNQTVKEAQAQATGRPYVVFVNGWLNGKAWEMNDLQDRLIKEMNAEIREVPYSTFTDGDHSGPTDNDSIFLRNGADFINNQLDANRPLILIGHSFGGDSVLKLLPRLNRRVQLVGVIDPVSIGGFRRNYFIPPKRLDYFVNRWQTIEPFPNNFPASGKINPIPTGTVAFQNEQNFARDSNGDPKRESCEWFEVCPDGKKRKRTSHQGLAIDSYVQQYLGDKIEEALANFAQSSQANTVPSGLYRKPNGTIVSANDNGAFCSFVSPAHFEFLSGRYDLVKPVTTGNISAMEDHGPCAVRLSPGVYRLEDGRIINSNGKAYCRYTSFDHYERIDGRPIQQIEGDVPLFAMENHNNCPESW